MKSYLPLVVAGGIELEFAVLDQVGREFTDMDHFGRSGVLESGAGNGGYRLYGADEDYAKPKTDAGVDIC